jgi:hypothetical protein
MRIRSVTLALVIATTFTAQAWSECPPGSAERSAEIMNNIVAGKTTASAQADGYLKFAAQCPLDPFVQFHAAQVWRENATAIEKAGDRDKAFQALGTSWNLLAAYDAIPFDVKSKAALHVGPNVSAFDQHQPYALREAVIFGFLSYDAGLGKTHAFIADRPAESACPSNASIDAMTAADWIRKTKQVSPAAMRMIDHAVAACSGEKNTGRRQPFVTRAKLEIDIAKSISKPQDALAWLVRARTDANAYLGGAKAKAGDLFWSEFDDRNLTTQEYRIRVAIGPSAFIPQTEWFAPKNLASGASEMAMAADFDQSWTNAPADKTSPDYWPKVTAYVTHVGKLAKQAEDQGLKESVWPVLYAAAKGHADGIYRSPGTSALPAPPDFAYSGYGGPKAATR